jgi:uncharacterized protein (TIRG00374 family)
MSRRALLIVAVAAVTVAFTALAIRGAHLEDVVDAIRDSNPLWLIPALLVLGLGVWLRAVRWQVLFPPESRPALWPVTASTLIGYFFTQILPLRAGEVARVIALNQRSGVSRAEIAGTVVIERVYDLIALLGLLFVLVPWLPDVTWLRAAAGFAAAVLLVVLLVVAALVRWGDSAVHRALRPFGRLPFVPSAQLEEIGTNLARGLGGLRNLRLAAWAFVLTVVSWVVLGLSAWFVFVAFDLGLSPAAGIFTLIALGLSAVLPAGPSGIGVFEAAVVVALRAYGVDDSTALSAALVLHALNFIPFVIAGLAVLRFHVRAPEARTAGLADSGRES